MRLLRVELRRLRLRRLVLFIALLGILGSMFVVLIASLGAQPVTAADREWAEQAYQDARADWEEHGAEMLDQCQQDEAAEAERSGEPVDFGCEQMEPQPEWYLPYEPPLAEYLDGVLLPFTMVLVLLIGVLIGATVIAAEFSAGSMATLLTFEPRRWRVYAAKMAAVGAGVVPLSLLMVGIVGGGSWTVFLLRDMEHSVPLELVWSGVRLLALLPAGAIVGAVLAFLVRSTGAVLGVIVGYTVVVEAILRNAMPAASPWIPGVNAMSWVRSGTSYYTSECTRGETGLMCEMVEQQISFGWSAGLLGLLAVVLVLIAGWTFARRDVA